MQNLIVICSDKSDNIIFDALLNIFKKLKVCFFASDTKTAQFFRGANKNRTIILLQIDDINYIKNIQPDILIIDEGFKIENYNFSHFNHKEGSSIVLVHDDFDSSLVPFLYDGKYTIISCGANPKDSVTISSVTFDTINIFIQRELCTVDFEKIEQQEICILTKDTSNQYQIMSCALCTLLLGFKKEFFEKTVF